MQWIKFETIKLIKRGIENVVKKGTAVTLKLYTSMFDKKIPS